MCDPRAQRVRQAEELGHFDDYAAHLPQQYTLTVNRALASSWLPVEVLMKHYATLEAVGLHCPSCADDPSFTSRLA